MTSWERKKAELKVDYQRELQGHAVAENHLFSAVMVVGGIVLAVIICAICVISKASS